MATEAKGLLLATARGLWRLCWRLRSVLAPERNPLWFGFWHHKLPACKTVFRFS